MKYFHREKKNAANKKYMDKLKVFFSDFLKLQHKTTQNYKKLDER